MTVETILDYAPAAIIGLTAQKAKDGKDEFVISLLNGRACDFLGTSSDAAIGQPISTLMQGQSSFGESLLETCRQSLASGTTRALKEKYRDARPYAWANVCVSPAPDGLILLLSDVSDDVQEGMDTDRKIAEVSAQAALLDTVLDSSMSGVITCSTMRENGPITDFRFNTVNAPAARMLKYEQGELPGKTLLEVFPGNVKSGLFDLYRKTVETGNPGHSEVYYKYDGLDFYLDVNARRLQDGLLITFTDISELKRTHISLEKTLLKLQRVVDSAQTGIFLFEPVCADDGEVVDFRFVLTNRMLAAYVHEVPEKLNGELGSVWFPGYKTNGLFDAYRETFLTGKQTRFDFHYNSDGIDVWLDIMATRQGEELLVTFGDYTPLKNLQQQLEASVEELRHSNAALEQFASIASHDLQEPLRKIQTFGNILKARLEDNASPEVRDIITRMQSAASRMRALIEDLLTYSHIASGNRPMQKIALNKVLNEVILDLEQVISEKGAEIEVGELPEVHGDPLGFRQLFHNLLSNALKFSRENVPPHVRISAKTVRGSNSGLALPADAASREFHVFTIADNGIGFEPEHGERIFGMFQRLHGRMDYPGTGVGLAIVQKVAEYHKGYFNAHGKPGQGATFRIAIPATGTILTEG